MTINELQEAIQLVCVQHPDTKEFTTGLEYEQDDAVRAYPHVKLVHPFTVSMPKDARESMTVNVKILVRTNELTINGETYKANYNTLAHDKNENSALHPENEMRDQAFKIAVQIVHWLKLYAERFVKYPSYMEINEAFITGVDRRERDRTTGANISLKINIGNPYICEAESIFSTYITQ